jgi:hypothetical protein
MSKFATDSRPYLSKSLRTNLQIDLAKAITTIGLPAVLRMIGDIVEEKSQSVQSDAIRSAMESASDSVYQLARNIH